MLSYIVVGARIRQERERRSISVADLAKAAGISTDYLYRIEQGSKQPGSKTTRALTEALDLEMEAVLVPKPPAQDQNGPRDQHPTGVPA